MAEEKSPLKESPSQTAGPYVHIGATPQFAGIEAIYEKEFLSVPQVDPANAVDVIIRVIEGDGQMVQDGLLEIVYLHAGQTHWQRRAPDPETSAYNFSILRPDQAGQDNAPHLTVWIAARGINLALMTRIYFPDEDNSADAVLALVPAERRETMVARKTNHGYEIDLYLQGERETVFFDI